MFDLATYPIKWYGELLLCSPSVYTVLAKN